LSHPHAHPVSPIDENHLLYGNFIGLQFVFETPLDPNTLAQAIQVLGLQFPALSGYYKTTSALVVPSRKNLSLKAQNCSDALSDILRASSRPNFIYEPNRRNVIRGRAPLSTFTLTQFKGGTQIFGIAISHLLTDAAGYHMLIGHIGDIYSALKSNKTPPNFPFNTHQHALDFGTSRSKAETLKDLKSRSLPKPIPIKGLFGKLIRSMIIRAMEKSLRDNPPIKIHFTLDQIVSLKRTILAESKEAWLSTNAVLCAHFTAIMAKLSYDDDIKTKMQIGQLLDLRSRYFEDKAQSQGRHVGNAILIHIENASFDKGLQNTTRGELARYFKERQKRTTPKDVKDRLDLLSDALRHGYTNPELDVKNPIISLNNQSKMHVYGANFNGQHPAHIFPQDVGDNIMFFPAHDGGLDIFIRDIVNPMRQQKLLTPKWQKRIFDF